MRSPFDSSSFLGDSRTLSVFDVTRKIKMLLESEFEMMWVEGEISNFKHYPSGHMYFSLKDEKAAMPCVMWARTTSTLTFKPVNGMKVCVLGKIGVFEKRGYYQLTAHQIQPVGVGALQQAFERLKQKLNQEGLFDSDHKKELPAYVKRVGIVTSAKGAAVRDLISVMQRRWPPAEIVVRPTVVQGVDAGRDIAAAIDECNQYGHFDVLIVGRGGGSIEDLWAFNEEVVARAIFASQIPVISAVGHEIDFTIADFVADFRAPTPSAAAERAVPEKREVLSAFRSLCLRSHSSIQALLAARKSQLGNVQMRYGFQRPMDLVHQKAQRLDELRARLQTSAEQRIQLAAIGLDSLKKQMNALSYQNTLQRGFVIAKDAETSQIIGKKKALVQNREMHLIFCDGVAESVFKKGK